MTASASGLSLSGGSVGVVRVVSTAGAGAAVEVVFAGAAEAVGFATGRAGAAVGDEAGGREGCAGFAAGAVGVEVHAAHNASTESRKRVEKGFMMTTEKVVLRRGVVWGCCCIRNLVAARSAD